MMDRQLTIEMVLCLLFLVSLGLLVYSLTVQPELSWPVLEGNWMFWTGAAGTLLFLVALVSMKVKAGGLRMLGMGYGGGSDSGRLPGDVVDIAISGGGGGRVPRR